MYNEIILSGKIKIEFSLLHKVCNIVRWLNVAAYLFGNFMVKIG